MRTGDRIQKTEFRSARKTRRKSHGTSISRLLTPDSCILNSSASGFTLFEVMVVIVIITILAGIVVGAAKFAQSKGARSRAQAEMAMMETALENYKNDNGIYPTTPAGRPVLFAVGPTYVNSALLYDTLTNKAYMTFKPNQLVTKSGITYIVDPFGSPYRYYCSPGALDQSNGVSFDLWSDGPNNKNDEGTNDDIANWKQN